MMTNEELDAIREQLGKITPGPWKVDAKTNETVKYIVCPDDWAIARVHDHMDGTVESNAEFIAHASENVPKLLDEVERLRRALERIAKSGNSFRYREFARQALNGDTP